MRLLAGAAFALLFALSFPFRIGALQFDLGTPIGWLALVPLALGLRGLGPRRAFGFGFLSATAAFSAVWFWIYVVVHVHGAAAPPLAAAAVVVLAALEALFVGGATSAAAALERRAGGFGFAVLPACWVAAEHLRGQVPFGGFPWAFLGYSAWQNGPLRELAAFGGVFALSLALACFATLAARGRLRTALALLAVLHLLGFAAGFGKLQTEEVDSDEFRVAVVQGNVPQELKWDPASAEQSFRDHLEASRLAVAGARVDLVVWPEAAATVSLSDERYRGELAALARETGAALLVGALGVDTLHTPPRGIEDVRFFNSAYAISGEGAFLDRYDKSQLVPFGEYLPLRPLLGFAIEALARGAAFADLTPGSGPRPLADLPGVSRDRALAPLICYEAIYPGLVREAVRAGGRVLINVTNDAWYGRTSAPHQFLAIAALRSAEHGLPMVRAANTGVSAIVAPNGKVEYQTPIFEEQVFARPLPPPRSGPTFYTRFGDWVVWLCWAGLAALGGFGLVRKGPSRPAGDRGRASGSR